MIVSPTYVHVKTYKSQGKQQKKKMEGNCYQKKLISWRVWPVEKIFYMLENVARIVFIGGKLISFTFSVLKKEKNECQLFIYQCFLNISWTEYLVKKPHGHFVRLFTLYMAICGTCVYPAHRPQVRKAPFQWEFL